jgi:hypothetical protein
MNEGEHHSVLASVIKCPSCGSTLEKGYAKTEAIFWDTKKRFFLGPQHLLSNRTSSIFNSGLS